MADLLDSLMKAGVVGAGGAGFPLYKKLDCSAEYLLVNGVECEPILETDKYVMRTRAFDIVQGTVKAKEQIGAHTAYIVLKEKYSSEIQALQHAIQTIRAPIQIYRIGSFYPAGDEQVMVYEVLRRIVPPGNIPLAVKTVVSNVTTMAWLADAINGIPVTRKLVSVLGEVAVPVIVDAPIGATVCDCVGAAGGLCVSSPRIILGGPMMGAYYTWEEAKSIAVNKTTGGIIVVSADWPTVIKKEASIRQIINRVKSCCIQCSYCTQQCPRNLIGHPIHPHKMMRALAFTDLIKTNPETLSEALLCSECGVCENYSCPMGLSPRRANQYIKSRLREAGIHQHVVDETPLIAPDMRGYYLLPTVRLLHRLNGAKYEMHLDGGAKAVYPEIVHIPLKQHIGKPADSAVKPGEKVTVGQTIGFMAEGALGANVHASIDGTVTAVDDCVHIHR